MNWRDILWIQHAKHKQDRLLNEFRALCDLEHVTDSAAALYRLRFDEPAIDAIVVDVDCQDSALLDQTLMLLPTIREIDPDIPIYVLIETDSNKLSYVAGAARATLKMRPHLLSLTKPAQTLLDDIDKDLKSHRSYDFKQRDLANEVASQYFEIETDRPGTVAYWLFEEEIIEDLVRMKERQKAGRDGFLQILDIGCGTGRFAKVILRASSTARITCVDFSGKMLKKASDILGGENCKFRRGLAEKLPLEFSDFDIVILGFGFPSYSPTRQVLMEARRVIAQDGWLFASVYNHNALAYERWTEEGDKELQRPISTWIDRDHGVIEIRRGSKVDQVSAKTFTPGQFARELKSADFRIGGFKTFPVLYSTLRCTEIESFANIERASGRDYPEAYKNKRFSHELWKVDKEVSASLRDRGFYATFLASPSATDVVEVANRLRFHEPNALSP